LCHVRRKQNAATDGNTPDVIAELLEESIEFVLLGQLWDKLTQPRLGLDVGLAERFVVESREIRVLVAIEVYDRKVEVLKVEVQI